MCQFWKLSGKKTFYLQKQNAIAVECFFFALAVYIRDGWMEIEWVLRRRERMQNQRPSGESFVEENDSQAIEKQHAVPRFLHRLCA